MQMLKIARYLFYFIAFIVFLLSFIWVFRISILNYASVWLTQDSAVQISEINLFEINANTVKTDIKLSINEPQLGLEQIELNSVVVNYDVFMLWQWWQNLSQKNTNTSETNQADFVHVSDYLTKFLSLQSKLPPNIQLEVDEVLFIKGTEVSTPLKLNTSSLEQNLRLSIENTEYAAQFAISDGEKITAKLLSKVDTNQIANIDITATPQSINATIHAQCEELIVFLRHQITLILPELQCGTLDSVLTSTLNQSKWNSSLEINVNQLDYPETFFTQTMRLTLKTSLLDEVDLSQWQNQLGSSQVQLHSTKIEVKNDAQKWQAEDINASLAIQPKYQNNALSIDITPIREGIEISTFHQQNPITQTKYEIQNWQIRPTVRFEWNDKRVLIDNLQMRLDKYHDNSGIKLSRLETTIKSKINLHPEIDSETDVSLSANQLEWQNFALTKVNFRSQFTLHQEEAHLVVLFQPKTQLRVATIKTSDILLSNNAIELNRPLELLVGEDFLKTSETQFFSKSQKLTMPEITVAPLNIAIKLGPSQINSEDTEIQASYNLSPAEVILPSDSFKVNDHNAKISLKNNSINTQGQIKLQRLPANLAYSVNIDSLNQSGSINIEPVHPLSLSMMQHTLKRQWLTFINDLDIKAGTVNFKLAGQWTKNIPLKHELELTINDLSAQFDDQSLSNLNLNSHLQIPFNSQKAQANHHQFTIEKLDIGVPISNINTSFHTLNSRFGEFPRLKDVTMEATIFMGQVSLNENEFDLNKTRNAVNLKLSDIDLAHIIATQQLDNVEVTGKLTGQLPIKITNNEISMQNGYLQSQGPGTIRYKLSDEQKQSLSNPLTDQVIAVLEDFHYKKITAQSAYSSDGNLIINFQINGTSPELYAERPININLNTEQNVISLLKSLQYTDNFNKVIEKRFDSSQ